MEGLRSLLGWGSQPVAAAPPPQVDHEEHQQKLSALANAQTTRVNMLEKKQAALQKEFDGHRARGDKAAATPVFHKKALVDEDLKRARALLAQTQGQLRTIDMAQSNLDQALLIKDGANVLVTAAKETDQIDVAGEIDKMKMGAKMVNQQTRQLTQPIFSLSGSSVVDDEEAQSELDRLFAVDLPDAPKVEKVQPVAGDGPRAARADHHFP